jgi:hypothetical protein
LQVADWFFDHERAKFPLAVNYQWNLIRRVANWVPFLLLLPALFAVFRKLVFPNAPMAMAPSVVLFLIGSFAIGPGLTSNLLLKENWGRPRPNSVQLAPARRNDAVLERRIERFSVALHKGMGAVLAGAGAALASAGGTLKDTGQHLHKRVACL